MRRDPEFHAVHRRESIQFLPLAAKLLAALPDTLLFFNHAGGSMVMSALLQAASAQPDYPHAAVPYADVGARFGISRTQVRKLLIAAEDAGLVRLHARRPPRRDIAAVLVELRSRPRQRHVYSRHSLCGRQPNAPHTRRRARGERVVAKIG